MNDESFKVKSNPKVILGQKLSFVTFDFFRSKNWPFWTKIWSFLTVIGRFGPKIVIYHQEMIIFEQKVVFLEKKYGISKMNFLYINMTPSRSSRSF